MKTLVFHPSSMHRAGWLAVNLQKADSSRVFHKARHALQTGTTSLAWYLPAKGL